LAGKTRLRNDLLCVEWDVKLLTQPNPSDWLERLAKETSSKSVISMISTSRRPVFKNLFSFFEVITLLLVTAPLMFTL